MIGALVWIAWGLLCFLALMVALLPYFGDAPGGIEILAGMAVLAAGLVLILWGMPLGAIALGWRHP